MASVHQARVRYEVVSSRRVEDQPPAQRSPPSGAAWRAVRTRFRSQDVKTTRFLRQRLLAPAAAAPTASPSSAPVGAISTRSTLAMTLSWVRDGERPRP